MGSWGLTTQPGPGISGHAWTSQGLVELTCTWRLERQHVTKGIKTALLLCEGLWGGFFSILSRLEPAQDSNFEVVLGWFLLSSMATSCLCSSRALTVLAALGTTPGLQPAPVGGGPLASGLSLQSPGFVPVA